MNSQIWPAEIFSPFGYGRNLGAIWNDKVFFEKKPQFLAQIFLHLALLLPTLDCKEAINTHGYLIAWKLGLVSVCIFQSSDTQTAVHGTHNRLYNTDFDF